MCQVSVEYNIETERRVVIMPVGEEVALKIESLYAEAEAGAGIKG